MTMLSFCCQLALFVYLGVNLFVYVFNCLSVVCLFLCFFVCVSISLCLSVSVSVSVWLSIHIFQTSTYNSCQQRQKVCKLQLHAQDKILAR